MLGREHEPSIDPARESFMKYELFYWPEIQGRGEFVRLALEDSGASYLDVARDPGQKRRLSDTSVQAPILR